jgi:PAS domain S-box-containing protein
MGQTAILVVEDEGIVARDLARKLEQLNYRVAGIADSGQEAVALALQLHPDLILMDIWLKGSMNGIEAVEAIHREQDVPVVYLTAHSDPATLNRAKLSGPFGYILKPFEPRDLATQIEIALYRHQADAQLRDQREWLRVTLASIGDAVIATDSEGRITFLNPVAESLSGWKSEDALRQPVLSVFRVVNEQTGSPLEEPVGRVLRDRRTVALANHAALIHKDGHAVPIEDSAAPIMDAAGRMIGVVLVFHEVTQKRRVEEALQRSEEQYKLLFAANPNPMFVFDEETLRFLAVNDAAVSHYGWPREEFLSMTIFDIRPPEDRHLVHDVIQRNMNAHESDIGVIRHRRQDGLVMYMEIRVSSISFSGRPGRLCSMNDVTERKRTAEALRESEQRFRLALRNAPVSVGVQDRDLRYIWAYNLRSALIEDVIGRSDADLFAPDEAAHFTAMKRRVLEENIELKEQLWLTRPTGRIFLSTYWEPIHDGAGQVIGVGSATVDLTAIKLAEEKLARVNEELESRVTERTAELAHRASQLRALAGELAISEQRERSRLAKVLHDHLQQLLVGAKFRLAIIEKGAEDLIKLAIKEVGDLIDESVAVSRDLTAELNPPILQEAGLNAGLQWLVRRMADKHGLFIDIEMEEDGSIPEQLRIFLFDSIRELLFNVVKHAHTSSAALSLRHVGDHLQVTISDPGVGFDPATMPAAGGGGVGYGLFSIHERVENLGGTLQIQSTPGEGSRIVLSVPIIPIGKIEPQFQRIPELPEAQPVLSNDSKSGRKIRVLLADDHTVVRQAIANMLGDEPDLDIVGQAGDGQEAVDLALKLLPDVALLDISMPKLNGIEATRIILREHPEISILGLSMFDEPDTAQAMRDAGAIDYLTKSGPADGLIKAIRKGACFSIES